MFKLIIFDFDGVLVDSNKAHLKLFRDTFRKAGIEVNSDDEEIISNFGISYDRILRKYSETEENFRRVIEIYNKGVSGDFYRDFVRPESINNALLKLKSRGVKLAVATGNTKAPIEKWMKYFDYEGLFDAVITADDVTVGKPDPEMLIKVMDKIGVAAEDTLFIGDKEPDSLAAEQAKVKFALVDADPKEIKADYYIGSISELSEFLNKLFP